MISREAPAPWTSTYRGCGTSCTWKITSRPCTSWDTGWRFRNEKTDFLRGADPISGISQFHDPDRLACHPEQQAFRGPGEMPGRALCDRVVPDRGHAGPGTAGDPRGGKHGQADAHLPPLPPGKGGRAGCGFLRRVDLQKRPAPGSSGSSAGHRPWAGAAGLPGGRDSPRAVGLWQLSGPVAGLWAPVHGEPG